MIGRTVCCVVVFVCACRSSAPSDVFAEHAAAGRATTRDAPEVAEPAVPSSTSSAAEDPVAKLLATLGVKLDREHGVLEVDGWVNQSAGVVEVFACAPGGKTHEAIVVLDCVPSGLHAGLLALGLEPGAPARESPDGARTVPRGDRVEIQVRWRDSGGATRVARAEDWIGLADTERTKERSGWVFTGSFVQPADDGSARGTFAADRVKTLASTYRDETTILENPADAAFDDTRYVANARTVPPVGTRITAIFRRESSADSEAKP